MKSLIIGFLCAVLSSNPAPSIASDIVIVPNKDRGISETVISGDANKDGSLNIADAVMLQNYLTSGYYEYDDLSRLDINFDGIIDSFDVILMRQTVLNPENAVSSTYSIDVLNSAFNPVPHDEVFTNADEVYRYLSKFLSDYSELQTYTERYDEAFFEDNNLVLVPIEQERGRGVFYEISGFGKMRPNPKARMVGGDEIFLTLSTTYDAHRMLYPETNAQLLVQVAVPKFQCKAGDYVSVYDTSEHEDEMSFCSYKSPDGKKEICIVQDTLGNISDIRVLLRINKISFKALTFLTADGSMPFTNDGEWSVDDDGNNVFGNGTTYSITWFDDAIEISHQVDGEHWEKGYVPLDEGDMIFEDFDYFDEYE